ncbi:hypothetical protein [Pseudonocardia asaccharolytica]|uniref:Asp23/Gls24 family envelope stress response protein n=1 Tax=Pseudonocardia asaccharolytica DSM 44247 = NBRC 16224 TaxID=1123024 RepID=A0A511D808_9PSEU|nr:hypothetical protein [Pseudonocardia asaccharolytica]GEL20553.1 hypothetical protein PA7_43900 [Pseudonocardia asaccharolytica DSM 44247 = NBRC 16224]
MPTRREDPDLAPQVRATAHGRVCSLQARLWVCYPAPVARVAEQIRAHLIDRLGELAGLQVREVDITVTALHHPHPLAG